MKYRNTALAATVAAGLMFGLPGLAMAHGQGGQGMMGAGTQCPGMSGQGMMGQGMGHGGMSGQGMMGRGMGHGGMMGPSYGKRVMPSKDLSVDDTRHFLEDRLAMHGNKRLKVGEVKEADKDKIVADIVTQDGSLVERFSIDRHTGRMTRTE